MNGANINVSVWNLASQDNAPRINHALGNTQPRANRGKNEQSALGFQCFGGLKLAKQKTGKPVYRPREKRLISLTSFFKNSGLIPSLVPSPTATSTRQGGYTKRRSRSFRADRYSPDLSWYSLCCRVGSGKSACSINSTCFLGWICTTQLLHSISWRQVRT